MLAAPQTLEDFEKSFKAVQAIPATFHRITFDVRFEALNIHKSFKEFAGKVYDFRGGSDNGLAAAEEAFESLEALVDSRVDEIRRILPLEDIGSPSPASYHSNIVGDLTNYRSLDCRKSGKTSFTPPLTQGLLYRYSVYSLIDASNYYIDFPEPPSRDSNGVLQYKGRMKEGPIRSYEIPLFTMNLMRCTVV